MDRDDLLGHLRNTLVDATETVLEDDGTVRGTVQPYPPGRQRGVSVLVDHDDYGLVELYAQDRDENCWYKVGPNEDPAIFAELQSGVDVQRHNDGDYPDIPPTEAVVVSVRSGASSDRVRDAVQSSLEESVSRTLDQFEKRIQSDPVVTPSTP